MKQEYQKPKMEVVTIDAEDVIVTSDSNALEPDWNNKNAIFNMFFGGKDNA